MMMDARPKNMNLILIGPPGCGKGTQAVNLGRRCNLLHFSTGNALRAHVKRGTPLGKEAEPYMTLGQLIPDDLIINVVKDTADRLPEGQGLLLDGFPRTIPQAQALDGILHLDAVIAFELDDEIIVERITGRLTGEDGQTYHVKYAPPPPGVTATQRKDDSEPVVRERLLVYHNQTKPLLDYYRQRGLLHTISALGAIEAVEAALNATVDRIVQARRAGGRA